MDWNHIGIIIIIGIAVTAAIGWYADSHKDDD